ARLVLAGCEVTVPEQRQLFFERPVGGEHPVRPPQSEALCFDLIGREAVEELVDHGLEPALRALRAEFFAKSFPVFAREAYGFGAAWRKRIHARIPDARLVERLQVVGERLEIDERVDRLARFHRSEARDVLGRTSKSGTFEEVRSTVVIPVGCAD